jgi:hypothetical protein
MFASNLLPQLGNASAMLLYYLRRVSYLVQVMVAQSMGNDCETLLLEKALGTFKHGYVLHYGMWVEAVGGGGVQIRDYVVRQYREAPSRGRDFQSRRSRDVPH